MSLKNKTKTDARESFAEFRPVEYIIPLGDGEGRGTPPPTAAAGEGAEGGVGAGEVRCCTDSEWCVLFTEESGGGGAL